MPLLAPVPVEAPETPPPPAGARPEPIHLRHEWIGPDGSKWDLCSADSGVRLMAGVRGFGLPETVVYTSESDAVDGEDVLGARTLARTVFWPLKIYRGDKAAWYAYDAQFWATLEDPTATGQWRIYNPVTRQTRKLLLQCVDDGGLTVDTDPGLTGWLRYGVNLIARRPPFWLGKVVHQSFQAAELVPYYGGPTSQDGGVTGGGPPYWLSRGNTLASASITNHGTVPAGLVYVADGPWDSGITVGIGSQVTSYNAAIPDGKSVVFETRQGRRDARLIDTPDSDKFNPSSDADGWFDEIATRFDQAGISASVYANTDPFALDVDVPARTEQALAISGSGNGVVHVALQPPYRRAW